MQPARADVLLRLVLGLRGLSERVERGVLEVQVHMIDGEQRLVLAGERVVRLGEDRLEVLAGERLQIDAHREAALQLRDEVGDLRHVERARGDEEHVVRLDDAVLGVDRAALDDGQDVALHALAADVRAVGRAPRDLVDLVDEHDAVLLGAAQRLLGHGVHVDELVLLLGEQDAAGIGDLHAALFHLFGDHVAHDGADVDACAVDLDVLGRVLDLDLDLEVLQLAPHELSAQLLAALGDAHLFALRQLRLLGLVAQQHVDGVDGLAVGVQDDVDDAVLGEHGGAGAHRLAGLLLADAHAGLDEVADDALHVAADVADLGELGRLDLDKRRVHQLGQTARDLGLAHAGGADHQNIFGDDLVADLRRELSAAVAVAQRDGDCALGLVLADDIAIELAHDLLGCQFHGITS